MSLSFDPRQGLVIVRAELTGPSGTALLRLALNTGATGTIVYTAVIRQDQDIWIGWIEEVPGVTCQEDTREELVETLRITLAEAIDFNRWLPPSTIRAILSICASRKGQNGKTLH